MRILLLNPPFLKNFSRDSRSPEVTKGGALYYPYYLAYTTGLLEKEGFDVKLIDAIANSWSIEKTINAVYEFAPNLTVINTSTPSFYNDMDIGSLIHSIGSFVVAVGTHVTAFSEEALSHPIDAVARGEYDYTLRGLALALKSKESLKKIKGLSWKGDKIIHNPERPLIKNLDELPFVSKVYEKHLDIKKYAYPTVYHPEVTILSGRGCKFQCGFCTYANIWWKGRYRFRSAKNTVDEMEWIENNLNVKEIMFEDDTFSSAYAKERVKQLCEEIIDRKLSIGWVANSRADVDYETLKIMEKAGCRLLCVGYESGSQAILNGIPKGLAIEQAIKFTENAKKAGIKVHACWILGLPKETKKTVEETIEFSLSLDVDSAQYYPPNVVLGSPIYKWAKENGYLKTENWSEWLRGDGSHACILDRKDLSSDYLEEKCDEALSKFYFRSNKIFSILWSSLKSRNELKRYWIGFKSYMSYRRK